jgi:penicillin-binding protein 1A
MTKTKSTSKILEKRAKKNQRSFFTKIFRWFLLVFFIVIIMGSIGIAGVFLYLSNNLPKISSLEDYRPPIITTVY